MNVIMALFVLTLLAIGFLTGTPTAMVIDNQTTDGDNVTNENSPPIPQHIVAGDPSTWPSGDRVWDCCRAIAYAEGYNVNGSVPQRLNNPGDLSDGANTFGFEQHSGSNVTTFPDANTGWSWLYTKVARAANGHSAVYLPSMSWLEIGSKWAPPNATVWASNVSGALGVDINSTLGDYITKGV